MRPCRADLRRGTEREAFKAGAEWAIRNAPEVQALVEVLAEVIRNSHDIVAKKRCSEALAAYRKSIEGEK